MSTQNTDAAEQTAEPSTGHSLSHDEVFHLLQNERRRNVIRYLGEHADETTLEMGDIATQLAAWENDKPVEGLTSDERQRVYIALYQNHLPKLDKAGVITYNQSRGRVEPEPLLERLDFYVSIDSDTDASPSEAMAGEEDATTDGTDSTSDETDSTPLRYFNGATVVSVALFTATTLGLAPAMIAESFTTLITGLFGTISLGVKSRTWARR